MIYVYLWALVSLLLYSLAVLSFFRDTFKDHPGAIPREEVFRALKSPELLNRYTIWAHIGWPLVLAGMVVLFSWRGITQFFRRSLTLLGDLLVRIINLGR